MTPKIIVVNPAMSTLGYSVITPRWLFVIARATPAELAGDPMLIDEAIQEFDPDMVTAGDIVGIGISTGNCLAGYKFYERQNCEVPPYGRHSPDDLSG